MLRIHIYDSYSIHIMVFLTLTLIYLQTTINLTCSNMTVVLHLSCQENSTVDSEHCSFKRKYHLIFF